MNPKVERLESVPACKLGEGPHWDAESQSLYFVDIIGRAIHKYVPATNKHTSAIIGTSEVSLILPIKGEKGRFLISIGRDLAVITWDGESENVSNIEKILEVENSPDTLSNRWNDGKCDRLGRLWAGTMDQKANENVVKTAAFYLVQNNKATQMLNNIGISNGTAWSRDDKKMYYIDSVTRSIDSFDFDINKGTIANRQTIFTVAKHNIQGTPDGMTIDTDGNLWAAVFNGHQILKIDPKTPETLLASIPMPSQQTTSLTFGGPNLDELYATSARILGLEDSPSENGSIYRITGINARGYPSVPVTL
ncbi:unnamed protein product [Phyllotreta striolata]|uniref:Regucalcin n=1 Tax=Phyllotreta striolata TaxID=444603 RepID=A0A9N9TPZ4_PHYSR|nr:unnamed protein product [Phyllotreta striolata]